MSDASQALQKIARGTGIVFAGTVISMLFGFFKQGSDSEVLFHREYGVFNPALTLLNITLVIATQNTLPVEVGF